MQKAGRLSPSRLFASLVLIVSASNRLILTPRDSPEHVGILESRENHGIHILGVRLIAGLPDRLDNLTDSHGTALSGHEAMDHLIERLIILSPLSPLSRTGLTTPALGSRRNGRLTRQCYQIRPHLHETLSKRDLALTKGLDLRLLTILHDAHQLRERELRNLSRQSNRCTRRRRGNRTVRNRLRRRRRLLVLREIRHDKLRYILNDTM